jgi:hypothetical protein
VIDLSHKNIRQRMQEETFPSVVVDPAKTDHFAAVIHENVDRLLADFERALKEARAPDVPQ